LKSQQYCSIYLTFEEDNLCSTTLLLVKIKVGMVRPDLGAEMGQSGQNITGGSDGTFASSVWNRFN
jgi:hypothetical protein